MNKISTEMLVSTLFKLGFDKVDPVLFTFTLGKISKDGFFSFEEQDTSRAFQEYVDFSDGLIKLKDGYLLDTNIGCNESISITIGQALFSNKYLYDYLSSYDFTDIIKKKIEAYGIRDIDDINNRFFSIKEIELMNNYYKNGVINKVMKR